MRWCLLLLLPSVLTSYNSSFPCPPYKERHPPTHRSVHQLRPEDIGLIASLGDSITAGAGAKARNVFEVLDENRGSTFFTGADEDWRSCPSVHNFIKEYNPWLQGGAHGSTRIFEIPFKRKGFGERGLNLSVSGAVAQDVPEMAKQLVKMVRGMHGWKHKWKLVSVLIGHNDLCSKSCLSPLQRLGISRRVAVEPSDYERNLRKTLNTLSRLPKTLVILLAPIQVSVALDLVNKGKLCEKLTHPYECPCLFGPGPGAAGRPRVDWLWRSYRKILYKLSKESRYNREDFAVEMLTTVSEENIFPMVNINGRQVLDLSLLAPDCYHFKKALHARIARNVWNNMLQSEGQRTIDYSPRAPLICPSSDSPYFMTKGNTV